MIKQFGFGVVAAISLAGCFGGSSSGSSGGGTSAGREVSSRFDMANGCYALQAADSGRYVSSQDGQFRASTNLADATRWYFKPTALGEYVLHSSAAELLTESQGRASAAERASPAGVWQVSGQGNAFAFINEVSGNALQFADDQLVVAPASVTARWRMQPVSGCLAYPEIQTDIVGATYKGQGINKPVIGFAEVHTHMAMGHEMSDGKHTVGPSAGGVMYGQMFHRFGVPHALEDCADWHGPEGIRDPESLVLDMTPLTTHDTQGWPTFIDWPKADSQLHQAMYYKWVERAWQAGLRLMVSEGTNIAALCELGRATVLRPDADCNDMSLGINQVKYLFQLQDYVDAQTGGPGKGWFRIVKSPTEARQVINEGKLAVVAGLEFSNIFDCTVRFLPGGQEVRGCTKEDIDRQIDEIWALGVREVFPYHDVDSALGGTGLFSEILNFVGFYGTGGFWKTYDCEDTGEGEKFFYTAGAKLSTGAPGAGGDPVSSLLLQATSGLLPVASDQRQCNQRLMTDLGEYVMQRLMEKKFVIDIDHAEIKIKQQMLDMANAQTPAYPLISAHGGHGGISMDQARSMVENGGLIYPFKPNGKGHVEFLNKMKSVWPASRGPIPLGFGMDANGIADRAGPRGAGSAPVNYPFTLFRGADWGPQYAHISPLTVNLQTHPESGKTWHIDEVGTAHYGMLADYVEEIRLEGGAEAVDALYRSAEAYLQMWEQIVNR